MSKKSRFRGPFEKQHGKRAQARFRPASHGLYHVHRALSSQLSWKKSLLLICQILGLLVDTLAADNKYPVLNRENLMIPIWMQLSKQQKTFCESFAAFLKSSLNFIHFEKEDDSQRFCLFEITESKKVVRKMSKKYRFRGPLNMEHGKLAQAMLKSASQHLYQLP